jgi:hypothetical protein
MPRNGWGRVCGKSISPDDEQVWQQACALLYGLEHWNGFGAKDLATAVGQSLQRRIYDSRKPICEDCGLKLPTFRGPGPEAKKGHLGAGGAAAVRRGTQVRCPPPKRTVRTAS